MLLPIFIHYFAKFVSDFNEHDSSTPLKNRVIAIEFSKSNNTIFQILFRTILYLPVQLLYFFLFPAGLPGAPQIPRNISTPTVLCKKDTTCSLFCYMSSDEPVRYTWTKNGKLLTSRNDVTIIDNVLLVTPRAEEDYGVHLCTAVNSAGRVEYKITLKDETKSSADRDESKGDSG